MIQVYRNMVRSFSEIKGFDGWMIAKAELEAEECKLYNDINIKTTEAVILRQRRHYSAIMSKAVYNGIRYKLIMHIVKPARNHLAQKYTNTDGIYCLTLKYAQNDIKQFVYDVGDSNYIHQTGRYVVPGFLVFEDILNMFIENTDFKIGKCTMLFNNPAFAGEIINVFKVGEDRFKLIISGKDEVYGDAIYNRRS